MVEITTRDFGSNPKGAALTNEEVDTNFLNLQAGIEEAKADAEAQALALAIALG